MKIKTKLMASAILPLGLFVLFGVTVLYTNQQISKVGQQQQVAVEIKLKVASLNSLIHYYLLRHEEQSKTQLQKIETSLGALLSGMTPANPLEEATIKKLHYDGQVVRNLISRLADLSKQGADKSASSRELEERLTGYVLQRAREMTAETIHFESMMDAKLAAAHKRQNLLILTFAGLFSVVILVGLLLTAKRVSAAIAKLQIGTSIIAGGNLDYEIAVSANDELAQLSRAFNSMAHELKKSYGAIKRSSAQIELRNRELQDFAFVASHDLQEPLRKIQAFGDQLKADYGERLDAEGLDYLERMQNAAARMQVLIQALLNYSRVATKAQPFSAVNLATVGHEALDDLEASIRETGGQVEISDLPTIQADPTQMRQLFQNLIGNALKFHGEERPVVKVYSQFVDHAEPGGRSSDGVYRILIEDNGIGFDEKYLDRIFTPFQRLHGRGVYEGTGIGLAICRKIVDRHHGSLTAKSAPGKGSTFIITLPIRQPRGETE